MPTHSSFVPSLPIRRSLRRAIDYTITIAIALIASYCILWGNR